MFKHTIGDEALKVIKMFSYTEDEDLNDWCVVMTKMEKHCIGEVNEIYERYCFNKRDKLPAESVDCFVAELKTLAKTSNFCECLRDSLIRDRIVLGIKDEQTTKKLLRIRDLTLNRCIHICRSEEIMALHMKSLLEPFCGYEHAPERKDVLRGAKCVCGVRKRIILRKGAKMPRLTPLRATKTWKRSVL